MASQGVIFDQFGDENQPSGAHLGSFGVIWDRFGTQNAPQEPPEDAKRIILGPKSAPKVSKKAILEPKMVQKGLQKESKKVTKVGSREILILLTPTMKKHGFSVSRGA